METLIERIERAQGITTVGDTKVEREWYENGRLKCVKTYKGNIRYGIWRGWNKDGKLSFSYNYKDGKEESSQEEWWRMGNSLIEQSSKMEKEKD